MKKHICISAYNIHQGGGKVVLQAFLKTKITSNDNITCYIDERLDIDFNSFKDIVFIKVKPSIIGRIITELKFKIISSKYQQFYFLGNLPPIFKLSSFVILFLQNRLILTPIDESSSLQLRVEKTWFNLFLKNANLVQIQTQSMQNLIRRTYPELATEIVNYLDLEMLRKYRNIFVNEGLRKELNSFIYIASTSAHKNLKRLILAFSKIQKQDNPYILYLNIHPSDPIYKFAKKLSVNIESILETDRIEILKRIFLAEYLIFPSLIESLGMPLVEATELDTKIIASNLDYVYDVCEPISVFDPLDVDSITTCIRQVLSTGNYTKKHT